MGYPIIRHAVSVLVERHLRLGPRVEEIVVLGQRRQRVFLVGRREPAVILPVPDKPQGGGGRREGITQVGVLCQQLLDLIGLGMVVCNDESATLYRILLAYILLTPD